jgi:hypothetical protein
MTGPGNSGQGLIDREKSSLRRHKQYAAGGGGDDVETMPHDSEISGVGGLYLRPDK